MRFLVKTPLSPYSGYGSDGLGIVRALTAAGHDVYVQPEHVDAPLPFDVARLLTKRLVAPFDVLLHHTDPGKLGLTPEVRRAATVTVGWTMWESTTLAPQLKNVRLLPKKLKTYDLVLGYDAVSVEALRPYVRTSQLAVLQGGFWPDEWKPVERNWFSDRFGFAMVGQLHAQPLDAKVLTPSGWKLIGDLTEGDFVVDPDGGAQKVQGVSSRKMARIYEITFSDGAKTRCTEDHLWRVNKKTWRNGWESDWSTVPLSQLISEGLKTSGHNWKWRVPSCKTEFQVSQALPLDPYLVGALCGDGCFSGTSIVFTNIDIDCLREVARALPPGVLLTPKKRDDKHPKQWSLTGLARSSQEWECLKCGTCGHHANRGLCGRCASAERRAGRISAWPVKQRDCEASIMRRLLTEIGVGKEVTPNKALPDAYLYASAEQRLSVLQGLMDTDGWVKKGGSASGFGSSSPALVQAVVHLVRSLGGAAYVGKPKLKTYPYKGETLTSKLPHREVHVVMPSALSPFRMARKREALRNAQQDWLSRKIVSIESLDEAEVQCISVSGLSGTYVTDDFIVTHNTRKDPWVAIQAFQELKTELPEEFDKAELHLKTNQPNFHPAMEQCIPKLRIHYDVWPQDILYQFYAKQHVLLAPSRGEGKNLPALEFQSTGGAVIATNWGGMTGWLDSSFSYPLQYSLAPANGQYPDCLQARADKDHLKELMLHVYRNRAEVRDKATLAAKVIPQSMSWDSVIRRLTDKINSL